VPSRPKRINPKRKISQPCLRFPSLLFLLLCSAHCGAFNHCLPTDQISRSRHYQHGKPHSKTSKLSTKTQIRSLSSSSLSFSMNRKHPSNRAQTQMHSLFPRYTGDINVKNDSMKDRCRSRNKRFGPTLLRRVLSKVLLLVAVAAIIRPGPAAATTAAVQHAIPTLVSPLVACPVSAETELRLMARLVLAAMIGAALGKERSFAKHSAGVRTMSLVSMGAAVFTICSSYGFLNFAKVDASRMAANVASGVGFVGAGVITTSMRNQNSRSPNNAQNNVVHGLTTAATIWLSAAVGVSCGVGLLRVATTAAFLTLFILRMGRKRKKNFPETDQHNIQREQRQQRHRSEWLQNDRKNPTLVDLRGGFDIVGETQSTKQWDDYNDRQHDEARADVLEKNETEPPISTGALHKSKEQETEIPKEKRIQLMGNTNSTVINDQLLKERTILMDEIIRSTWEKDNYTVTTLVDIVLNRVEQRERISRGSQKPRDDHSSSSNAEFLLP